MHPCQPSQRFMTLWVLLLASEFLFPFHSCPLIPAYSSLWCWACSWGEEIPVSASHPCVHLSPLLTPLVTCSLFLTPVSTCPSASTCSHSLSLWPPALHYSLMWDCLPLGPTGACLTPTPQDRPHTPLGLTLFRPKLRESCPLWPPTGALCPPCCLDHPEAPQTHIPGSGPRSL